MELLKLTILLMVYMLSIGQIFASPRHETLIDRNVSIAAFDDNKIAYISYAKTKAVMADLFTYDLVNREKNRISSLHDVFIDNLIYKNGEMLWRGESYSRNSTSTNTSNSRSNKILVWLDTNGKVKAQWDIAEGFKSATIWNEHVYIINVLLEIKKLEKSKPMPSLDLSKINYPERNGISRQIKFLDGPNEQLTFCNGPSGMKADDWATYCYQVDKNGIKKELPKIYSLYRAYGGVSNHPIFCENNMFWFGHAKNKFDLFHKQLGAKETSKLGTFTNLPIINCYNSDLYLYSDKVDKFKAITGKSDSKLNNLFIHRNIFSSTTGNIWPVIINKQLYEIMLSGSNLLIRNN